MRGYEICRDSDSALPTHTVKGYNLERKQNICTLTIGTKVVPERMWGGGERYIHKSVRHLVSAYWGSTAVTTFNTACAHL